MLMDRAYEGEETRQLVLDLGFGPVVPPKTDRKEPWEYDRDLYKRRNEVERLFRRLKDYRRIVSRFEKLDIMFRAFLNFVLIVDMIKCQHALTKSRSRQTRSGSGLPFAHRQAGSYGSRSGHCRRPKSSS